MSSISDIAMDIEELFFVENKTVFEIAETVNFPVDEIRKYLESIDEDVIIFPELEEEDIDDIAACYGHMETYSEFD